MSKLLCRLAEIKETASWRKTLKQLAEYKVDSTKTLTGLVGGNILNMRHIVGNNKHVWDGNNITAEKYYSSVTVYVYGIALIKSGTRYYLYSWHGDVIALINLAGSITKTYEYDAFGVEDDIDDSDSNPWRYCGEYYDKETKELYLWARYYDSVTGTFTQEDPI